MYGKKENYSYTTLIHFKYSLVYGDRLFSHSPFSQQYIFSDLTPEKSWTGQHLRF